MTFTIYSMRYVAIAVVAVIVAVPYCVCVECAASFKMQMANCHLRTLFPSPRIVA